MTSRHFYFWAFHHSSCLWWAVLRPLISMFVCFLRLFAEKETAKSHQLHLTYLHRQQTNTPLLFAVCWWSHFVWSACTLALGTRSKTQRNCFAVDWAYLAKCARTTRVLKIEREREKLMADQWVSHLRKLGNDLNLSQDQIQKNWKHCIIVRYLLNHIWILRVIWSIDDEILTVRGNVVMVFKTFGKLWSFRVPFGHFYTVNFEGGKYKRIDPPPFFLAMPVMPIETVACIDKPAEVNKPLLQIKAVS